MSIISAGTTTTTALSSTGNTDGTLQFQVNGTTASVTLNTLGAIGVGSTPNFGTAGQALVSAGSTAAPTWASVTTSPAGSNTQIQYNNSGSFGASSALTFDSVNLATNTAGSNATMGINSTSSSLYLQSRPDVSYSRLVSSVYLLDLLTVANQPITFSANSAERFRFGGSGQLGIGGANYGTSGQVLTSGGASAAPSWTTPSAGAVSLISTTTASAAASVIFTGLTTDYAYYYIQYDSLFASSAGPTLEMFLSSNNGSSYIGAGQYTYTSWLWGTAGVASAIRNYASSRFEIAAAGNGMGTSATKSNGFIYIFAPASTSCNFTWETMNRASTEMDGMNGIGGLVTAAAVNAIKIQPTSAVNITGTFRLYGVAKT